MNCLTFSSRSGIKKIQTHQVAKRLPAEHVTFRMIHYKMLFSVFLPHTTCYQQVLCWDIRCSST